MPWYMYTGKQRCSSVWKMRRWLVFLQQYGYESTQAEACLNHLGARVSLSARGMEHYPHEMGIFLGYPLEDVEGIYPA